MSSVKEENIEISSLLKKEETYYEKEVDVCRINRTGFRASDMGNVVEAEELMADKVNLYMKAAMEEYQIRVFPLPSCRMGT